MILSDKIKYCFSKKILLASTMIVSGMIIGIFYNNHLKSFDIMQPRVDKITEATYTTPVFSVSPNQWNSLTFVKVNTRIFESEKRTDGQITIDDNLNTPVFSPYSGKITHVIAKLGDIVKKGQPLFTIQASEFVQIQNDLISANASLRAAQAQFHLAQISESRFKGLLNIQAGSMKDWQQSQLNLAIAEGNLDTAKIALAAVHGRLNIFGKTKQEISSLERSPLLVNPEVEVLAPISGTVIQRQIGVGQYISSIINASSGSSTTPLYTIGDLSKVWLTGYIREPDVGQIHIGDKVLVKVTPLPNRIFEGKIDYIAPTIDPTNRRLLVYAEIDNSDFMLKPQMLGYFTIINGNPSLSLTIPNRSIIYEKNITNVWVADPNKKTLELRQVQTGRVKNDITEIISGLNDNEYVVIGGPIFIDRPT